MVVLEVGVRQRRPSPRRVYERARKTVRTERWPLDRIASQLQALDDVSDPAAMAERSAYLDAFRERLAVIVADADLTLVELREGLDELRLARTETVEQTVKVMRLIEDRLRRSDEHPSARLWNVRVAMREAYLVSLDPPPPSWVAYALSRAGIPVRHDAETGLYLNDLRDAYPAGWAEDEYRRWLAGEARAG